MKWRNLLGSLAVLLLVLPLAWLSFLALRETDGPRLPSGVPQLPRLSPEERLRLLTYKRACDADADCEPPLGCIFHEPARVSYCSDSTCLDDRHCPDGFTCRTLDTLEGTAQFRFCVLVGTLQEGQQCRVFSSKQKDACGPGLICQGWCGRPCQREETASCPEGFSCVAGPNGPSCLPSCEGRSCPPGQDCVQRGEGASFCFTVHGEDCHRSPCPQGQQCVTYESPARPGSLWRECQVSCGGEAAPSCPEGTVCYLSRCHRACNPETSSSCGPDFRCGRRDDDAPWTCLPD
jgi:hypothetical protein